MKKKVREFAATLKEYREKRGISQRKLAVEMGVHYRTYQGWEYGLRSPTAAAMKYLQQFMEDHK